VVDLHFLGMQVQLLSINGAAPDSLAPVSPAMALSDDRTITVERRHGYANR
jgi:hypothetical protein